MRTIPKLIFPLRAPDMILRRILRRQCENYGATCAHQWQCTDRTNAARRTLLPFQGLRSVHSSRRFLQHEQDPPSSSLRNDFSMSAELQRHIEAAEVGAPPPEMIPEERELEQDEDFIDDVTKKDPKYLAALEQERKDLANIDAWKAFRHIRT